MMSYQGVNVGPQRAPLPAPPRSALGGGALILAGLSFILASIVLYRSHVPARAIAKPSSTQQAKSTPAEAGSGQTAHRPQAHGAEPRMPRLAAPQPRPAYEHKTPPAPLPRRPLVVPPRAEPPREREDGPRAGGHAPSPPRPVLPPSPETTAPNPPDRSSQVGEHAPARHALSSGGAWPTLPPPSVAEAPQAEPSRAVTPSKPPPSTRRSFAAPSVIEMPSPTPAEPPRERWALGMNVVDLPPAIARHLGLPQGQGAAIIGLAPGGAAALAGLRVGDAIVEVNGQTVSSAAELCRGLASLRSGTVAHIAVRRPTAMYIIDRRTRTVVRPRHGALYHLGIRVP